MCKVGGGGMGEVNSCEWSNRVEWHKGCGI